MSRLAMSLVWQPTLVGTLVSLRPLRPDDYESLCAAASDPAIWEQHPRKRYLPEIFAQFFSESLESGGALVALDAATGSVIGSSRFHAHDAGFEEVEIGWTFLKRTHWGGRYNGEMKRLMLEHAFQFVSRVVFLVAPENVRSERALVKVGAIRAGTRLNVAGAASHVYAITKADWYSRARS